MVTDHLNINMCEHTQVHICISACIHFDTAGAKKTNLMSSLEKNKMIKIKSKIKKNLELEKYYYFSLFSDLWYIIYLVGCNKH